MEANEFHRLSKLIGSDDIVLANGDDIVAGHDGEVSNTVDKSLEVVKMSLTVDVSDSGSTKQLKRRGDWTNVVT